MTQDEQVKAVLQQAFPDVCDAVGPKVLAGITSGEAEFVTPKSGQFFDILTFMQLLAAAAAFIKSCLEIRSQLIQENKGRAPTDANIIERAQSSAAGSRSGAGEHKLSDEEKRKIVASLPR